MHTRPVFFFICAWNNLSNEKNKKSLWTEVCALCIVFSSLISLFFRSIIISWWRCGYWLPTNHNKTIFKFFKRNKFWSRTFLFYTHSKTIPSYLYVCLRFALGKCRWMLSILPVQAIEYIWNKPQLINLNVQIYLNIFNSVDINCHEIVTDLPFIRKRQTSMRPMHRWRTHFGYNLWNARFQIQYSESNKFGASIFGRHLIWIE